MLRLDRVGSLALTILALSLCASRSSAQSSPHAAENAAARTDDAESVTLPLRLTERPLTLPRGKVVLTSGVGLEHYRVESVGDGCILTVSGMVCLDAPDKNGEIVSSSVGVAVGAIDALEVGLVPIRLRSGMAWDGGRESLLRDPLLYVEAAALRLERFQLGFGYQVLLPLRSDTVWLTQLVSLDLLARSRFVRGEASTFVRFDSPIREDSVVRVGGRVITPGVSARVTAQVADPFAVFFGFQSLFFDSSIEGHVTNISTGFVGTFRRSTGEPVADIRFTFGGLDVRRYDEGGVVMRGDTRGGEELPCELAVRPDGPSGDCGVVPGTSTPVRRFTFELSATFYFHDAW